MLKGEKKRQYQNNWIKRRREKWFRENGPCKVCGSWKYLELDHIKPETKLTHRIWSWNAERQKLELIKCQALCKKCHKIKSDKEKTLPIIHGTRTGWEKGCRCKKCHNFMIEYWKEKSKIKE